MTLSNRIAFIQQDLPQAGEFMVHFAPNFPIWITIQASVDGQAFPLPNSTFYYDVAIHLYEPDATEERQSILNVIEGYVLESVLGGNLPSRVELQFYFAGPKYTASSLMRLSPEIRMKILNDQLLLAEADYRHDPELATGDLLGAEDYFDETPAQ